MRFKPPNCKRLQGAADARRRARRRTFVLQVPDNKADAVPCERLPYFYLSSLPVVPAAQSSKDCPVSALPNDRYSRTVCLRQMKTDVENLLLIGKTKENGDRNYAVKYCRACELSCPVGA